MPTASTATLATLRDRVEVILQDSTNVTYATGDIDEAIRQALHSYQVHIPRETVGTITLSAAGREIDVSSLTGYLEILRVWWDYTAADPEHPPNWRDFQVWPGDLIWINDTDEPASGDVLRVWYTLAHTLKDLDSAAATTFRSDHETIIAQGAAGYAAHFRAHEITENVTADGWAPRNLRDWAHKMLEDFHRDLTRAAAKQAAAASGIAPMDQLDRWDIEGEW